MMKRRTYNFQLFLRLQPFPRDVSLSIDIASHWTWWDFDFIILVSYIFRVYVVCQINKSNFSSYSVEQAAAASWNIDKWWESRFVDISERSNDSLTS